MKMHGVNSMELRSVSLSQKIPRILVETEISLQCSLQPATFSYPETDQSNPLIHHSVVCLTTGP
jgi:hypothetical protein